MKGPTMERKTLSRDRIARRAGETRERLFAELPPYFLNHRAWPGYVRWAERTGGVDYFGAVIQESAQAAADFDIWHMTAMLNVEPPEFPYFQNHAWLEATTIPFN